MVSPVSELLKQIDKLEKELRKRNLGLNKLYRITFSHREYAIVFVQHSFFLENKMNYLQSSKIIFVPLPEEEFGHLTKQRDKLTGNTKSGKKKLKNAQEKYLSSRFATR